MKISISADSGNKHQLNVLVKASQGSREAIRRALWVTGLDLAGNGPRNSGIIKQEMNRTKSGREYAYGRASRAGESPGIKSGKLIDSVYKRAYGSNEIDIGANTPYARVLEKGGSVGRNHSARIARRNFLIRPILNHRRKIVTNITNELNKILK